MGKETLTHDEIASLLPVESTDSRQTGNAAPAGRQAAEPEHSSDSLSLCDQAAITRLRAMSGELACAVSAALSELMRATVVVEPSRVDHLTYGEFVLYRDHPTCFTLLQSDAAGGPFVLDIELSILFPMIERMLGGDLQATTPHSRPLTDIEKRLASRIAERYLQELQTIWQEMGTFGLTVASIESEPRKTEPLLSKEPVACIQLQVVIGSSRGAICLAVPWSVAENPRAFGSGEDDRQLASDDNLFGEEVELSAVLARTSIAATDIQSLQVGDVITTEINVGELLEVTVDGESRFRASPGVLNGHKAIRIE